MATRYNNRKIIVSQQTIPIGKVLPGMIVTFNYAEAGVTDPRPTFLFLYHDTEKKLIEGLNLNYINPTKIKKLFQVIQFKKGKLDDSINLFKLSDPKIKSYRPGTIASYSKPFIHSIMDSPPSSKPNG